MSTSMEMWRVSFGYPRLKGKYPRPASIHADEPREKRFDPSTVSLAVANTRQSLIKHVLTEGDRITVSRISPLEDQGGYAVAMNYGT